MPTCSLIIPVYNHAAYLEECIDSALAQVVPFDEVVIVDDCSPDKQVSKILAGYKDKERVRIYKNAENIGIAATQNYAISLCQSEFVAFLDCDDYLEREARAGFDAYYELKEGDYFFSNRVEVLSNGSHRKVDVSKRIYEFDTLGQCIVEHMVASHFKVIRKSSLDAIGRFPLDSDGVQDWVVAVRIINDENAIHMAEYLYYHRIHPDQTTGQDSIRYTHVVNAERERILAQRGLKRAKMRAAVGKLAPYFSRVADLPEGAFLIEDGLFKPWSRASFLAAPPSGAALLVYGPQYHSHSAQDFFLTRNHDVEIVMIVDHKKPNSIAITRWANAFYDHIVCLDSVARLAVEAWIADKAKIVQGNDGNLKRELPVREETMQ